MSSPLRIAIAKANLATATRLAELGRQTFSETFAASNTPEDMAAYLAESYGPEIQLAQLQDPRCTCLLAEMQGQTVGYALLQEASTLGLPTDAPATRQLEIKQLYVVEDWIGTGLGKALMRRTLDIAQAAQVTAVVLGVWEHNERAKAFYQRFGFREVGEVAFRLGQDVQRDLIYRKGLAGRAS
ncbi:GNAT family N-acetyltransferase [Hymenobacter ginsengisoli]|uniref:GNAT family N-acetyltransferase n=1 Tax=Hymenobacter ginsengisoli TaxID=1051626 RepID=A0ABP8QL03_9BACT|nr:MULTISPECIES: GNAT family N-acetyltransferase [unclassified Hymenobacter]MBO2029762.1 GNAT family N-acetyltransferase [Hymenobacter sp. BT559]